MVSDRCEKGRFKRKHKIWSPDNKDDGWIDAQGRYWVYYPAYRKCNQMGYARRSWVHYEYYNKTNIHGGYDVHHKDKNRLNDSKENLILIKHSEHFKKYHLKKVIKINRICKTCKNIFVIKKSRLNDKLHKGNYCSVDCRKKRIQSRKEIEKRKKSLTLDCWSRKFNECINCKTTNYKHVGKGLCKYCYQKKYLGDINGKRKNHSSFGF